MAQKPRKTPPPVQKCCMEGLEPEGCLATEAAAAAAVRLPERRRLRVAHFDFPRVLGGAQTLVARGTSHLKYWSFPICAAVLYLPPEYDNEARPITPEGVTSSAMPKVLELRYLRAISGTHAHHHLAPPLTGTDGAPQASYAWARWLCGELFRRRDRVFAARVGGLGGRGRRRLPRVDA